MRRFLATFYCIHRSQASAAAAQPARAHATTPRETSMPDTPANLRPSTRITAGSHIPVPKTISRACLTESKSSEVQCSSCAAPPHPRLSPPRQRARRAARVLATARGASP
ncbi:hypothetical protein PYCCODRAFT_240533 [Trametes coccinea BRFM310]|uniref:Uncharacterized protein n=1 Tax=Trametes coccinea (strain BRFM310) TaxID=1353009 RepID=A0A1Y2IR68_TRAC3|nr:hypothetical protein PYCCODRAFT_240533 [Trametes coccinea BRFM310]